MGIGKTTLAKSVYQDPKVEDYFDVRGWITMPQQYNKSQMIRLLLRSISPAVENKLGKGSAPNNLVEQKLKLSGTKLSQRDLTTIGMLPELRVLKLENALLGRVWEVAEGEFRKLRFLLIEDKKLKQLQSDETYTLLHLKRLVLRCCNCLEQIPSSFFDRNMKRIELDGCNPSFVASAKQLIINHVFGRVELIVNGAVYLLYRYRRNGLVHAGFRPLVNKGLQVVWILFLFDLKQIRQVYRIGSINNFQARTSFHIRSSLRGILWKQQQVTLLPLLVPNNILDKRPDRGDNGIELISNGAEYDVPSYYSSILTRWKSL
nr:putative late blight resistance protein homolog R1A-4 isoform X1 [Ipomoea batatas]